MTIPTITQGRVGAIYLASGASAAATNKAMQEVNLSADPSEIRPRYSVYEVTDAAYRHLDDAVTPVFQYKEGGTSAWLTIPGTVRVEPQDCRIYLGTPLASADTVQMTSANVITPTMVQGVENWKLSLAPDVEKKMFLRDTAKRNIIKTKDWSATAKLTVCNTCATLTTSLGANKDITFTHVPGGLSGNDVSVEYLAPSGSTLSITVTGNAIVVQPATTSTALQLVSLWNKTMPCIQDLGVRADLKAGEDGSGALDTVAHTHLSGGLNPVNYTEINGVGHNATAVCVLYQNLDNDARWVGYCTIPKADIDITGDGINGLDITFETRGGQNGEIVERSS